MKSSIAAILAYTLSGLPAQAATASFFDRTYKHESAGSGGYSARNPNGSAIGRYQMILSNWEKLGYVEPGHGGDWSRAKFTSKAVSAGVSSVDDLLYSSAGHQLQDTAASQLAKNMWDSLGSSARSYVGTTVNGVTINEAGLLGGSWFLGPSAMNKWAESGFTVDGLASLPNIDSILAYNPSLKSVEDLHAYLMNRMSEYGDVDISEITNGSFTPGGGEYVQDTYYACEQTVQKEMQDANRAYIEGLLAAAQDDTYGFSQMQQPFGKMSCIDFAFNGGLDILFTVPSIKDIINKVVEMACAKVDNMVNDAIYQVNSEIAGTVNNSIGADLGPLQNVAGASLAFNANKPGVNIGVGLSNLSANPKYHGTTSSFTTPTPNLNARIGSPLDDLFE